MTKNNPIILFDGTCNMCNGVVRFVTKRDPDAVFRFASLQSKTAKMLLNRLGYPPPNLETMILIEDETVYTHSTACLRIARRLRGWRWLFWLGKPIPRFIRDALYRWIARHRYQWFGSTSQCSLSDQSSTERFIKDSVT